ncbi:hypothetical protein P691DRAFT_764401 [Macrolepiota fuliginosa MF-IS2]|uniref:Uncharacterized protein n=1 Tax=Macrolepiota fuliginosa MF-IS2 TaxID=1400762 RepID=A0A9P5X5P9_9AGAR|nr:hypothetical protein P691DRAFT_764401 [Macrolepiota fuliginosa MF-IS2]
MWSKFFILFSILLAAQAIGAQKIENECETDQDCATKARDAATDLHRTCEETQLVMKPMPDREIPSCDTVPPDTAC